MLEVRSLGSSSNGNCYLVNDGESTIMLDAGLPIKKIKEHVQNVCDLSGCLITHEHGDHAKGVNGLLSYSVDVYGSVGTISSLNVSNRRLRAVEPLKVFNTSDKKWVIYPFDVKHDAKQPLGYIIRSVKTNERLVYLTDTSTCKYNFGNVDYYLIEANYCNKILKNNIETGSIEKFLAYRIIKTHLSIDKAINLIENCGTEKTKHIYLLHLSNKNSNEAEFVKRMKEATGVPVTAFKE